MDERLPPLPPQPDDVAWPTAAWPEAPLSGRPGVDAAAVEAELDALFEEPFGDALGETHALVLAHRGELVAERYDAARGPDSTLPSWSMAKSITHALVGLLVRDGRLDPAAPAPVPAWQGADDPRRAVTLDHLLRMLDGLEFVEVYEDAGRSDVVDMLFRTGRDDVAGFAESFGLAHRPGTWWNYSSGTSNIVAAIVGRTVGGGAEGMERFMRAELFDRIGMQHAKPRFDTAGTFIGSSFVFDTARDFAKFGLLYLRDGRWDGAQVLPAGWVDHARTLTPQSNGWYGAHFWRALDGSGRFHCSGFRGQYIAIDPARDLVLVRLGNTEEHQRRDVLPRLRRIVESFPVRG